jgi:transcriptional regulator with XRE-family HTH domain
MFWSGIMTTEFKITKSQISKLAKNLRALLSELKVSENDIAQSLNIPVMTVRRLVSGETTDPRISTLKLFADYFNISVDSLIEDHSNKSINITGKNTPQFVPILDWNTAAKITSVQELDLKSWKDWYPVILGDESSLSENAFALTSKPSMQPRFPLGTLLIIDSIETPIDGDLVLIQMKKDNELSLRELIIDPPKWQLQPVTPGSEILFYDKKQHRIAGIVILIMLHSRKNK